MTFSDNQTEPVPLSIPYPEIEYPANKKTDRFRKSRINTTKDEIIWRTCEHVCLVIRKQAKTYIHRGSL